MAVSKMKLGELPVLPDSTCSVFWHPAEAQCSRHLPRLFFRILGQCARIYLPYSVLVLLWRKFKPGKSADRNKSNNKSLLEDLIGACLDTARTSLWLASSYAAAGSGMCLSRYVLGENNRWAHMAWTMLSTIALSPIEKSDRRRAVILNWAAVGVETVARLAMSRDLITPFRGGMIVVYSFALFLALRAFKTSNDKSKMAAIISQPLEAIIPESKESRWPLSKIMGSGFLVPFLYSVAVSRSKLDEAFMNASQISAFCGISANLIRFMNDTLVDKMGPPSDGSLLVDALSSLVAGQAFRLVNTDMSTPLTVYFLLRSVEALFIDAYPALMSSEIPYVAMMAFAAPVTQMAMFWENHHAPRSFAKFVYRSTGQVPFPEGSGYNAVRAAIGVPVSKPANWWF